MEIPVQLRGTGHPLKGYARLAHVGTIIEPAGPWAQPAYVWHVFETTEDPER